MMSSVLPAFDMVSEAFVALLPALTVPLFSRYVQSRPPAKSLQRSRQQQSRWATKPSAGAQPSAVARSAHPALFIDFS